MPLRFVLGFTVASSCTLCIDHAVSVYYTIYGVRQYRFVAWNSSIVHSAAVAFDAEALRCAALSSGELSLSQQ
jgi:Na+/melibiose symporter-like transporter